MSVKTIKKLTERGVMADLLLGLENAFKAAWYAGISNRVDSTQPDGENHDWLGSVEGMKEQKGNPEFDEAQVFEFFIRNIRWQCGFRVRKDYWDHGKRSLIEQRVQDQTTLAAVHPGQLIETLIANAGARACYDGEYFYDTDHPVGSATQSNIITISTSAPSKPAVELIADAILETVVRLWGMKDDKGNYVNVGLNSFMLTCGATMYPGVAKAIKNQLLSGGGSNVVYDNKEFSLKPQLLPSLTGNKFQLHAMSAGAAPFVYQVIDDTAPEVLGRESEYCKLYDYLLFMLKGGYNAGYGRYQRSAECQFTQA